jgi:long-chain acyl-CoA synthetase
MALPLDHAAAEPERVAVIDEAGRALTYGALDDRAKRLASLIRAAGVGEARHIALCLENRLEYFWAVFGGLYAGVYYTAISPWLHPAEIAYIVDNCRAELVIASAATREKMAAARRGCRAPRRWLTLDGAAEGYEALEDAMADQPATLPPAGREGRDMLYSSGTTGLPKGVKHPLPSWPFGEEEGPSVRLFDYFGLDRETVYLNPAPLYHAAPLRWSVSVLRRGGRVVSMSRFDAARALDLMARHRVTAAQFVPTMMIRMLKLPDEAKAAADLSALRRVVHAAAPCPVETKRQIIAWWGPIVDEYYAGTESNGLTFCTAAEWLERPGTVGRALVGTLHILDDAGRELPPGQTGRVYFSGTPPFAYHDEPEKTAAAYVGDKSTLGDIGYVDDDGYLFLTDRDVNLIVCGGINIYPQLTEDLLAMHPDVADAAVIGTPDPELGEVVLAVVEPAPDADRATLVERLRAHCAAELPTIRQPRHYDLVDALPRHPNGKLRKVELRDAYRARPPAQPGRSG